MTDPITHHMDTHVVRAARMVEDTVDPRDVIARAMVPVIAAPSYGACPVLEEALCADDGNAIVLGRNDLTLVCRTPWLEANIRLASWKPNVMPFGQGPDHGARLRCARPPAHLLGELLDYFRSKAPNEAGAFLVHSPAGWRVAPARTVEATPSSLRYEMPDLAPGEVAVADCHSHPVNRAFFSSQDDADDQGSTQIKIVFGLVNDDAPEIALRLMVMGIPQPIPLKVFQGDIGGYVEAARPRGVHDHRTRHCPQTDLPASATATVLAERIVDVALAQAGAALLGMSRFGERDLSGDQEYR